MAGYTWATHGDMMFSENLSNEFRTENQPLCRYRQLCDMPDPTQPVTKSGDKFHWNIYLDLERTGNRLAPLVEDQPIPTSKGGVAQGSATVIELGWGTPYTGKMEALSTHPPRDIIDVLLRNDSVKTLDTHAEAQFSATPLKVSPAGGIDASAIEVSTDGTAPATNNSAMTLDHVLNITNYMAEADMPGIRSSEGEYYCIGRPTVFNNIKKELESVRMYTETGFGMAMAGEIGRHHGVRFITQTNIKKPGWTNGASDVAHFVAADAVTEAVVLPEQIRVDKAKHHGRLVEMAWYYLGNFKITRELPEHARIVQWDSAA